MALVGNRSVLLKSPARWLNGGVGIMRSAFSRPGELRSADFSPLAGIPLGHLAPSSWLLPKQAGAMSSVNFGQMSVASTGFAVGGITTTGTSTLEISFAVASGQLIASGTGTATLALSTNLPLLIASLGGAGTAGLTLTTNTPTLGAIAGGEGEASLTITFATATIRPLDDTSPLRTATTTISLNGTLVPFAKGFMVGTTEDLGLTVAGITNAVWNASLINYQEAGSAGKALSAASSGGVDYEALGLAVWQSVTRTLTSSSGTAPTAIEVADAVWAKVLP